MMILKVVRQALFAALIVSGVSHAQIYPRSNTESAAVVVTTFNLKWFGIGGTPTKPEPEHRIPYVRDFLAKFFRSTQVYVFEEVVDLRSLASILPSGWRCSSYKHSMSVHQYIAICASADFSLQRVTYDNNNTIEEVAEGSERMRPAVRMDLKEKRSGKILMTIVGVHLKAMPEETSRRIMQAKAISADLARVPQERPVLVLGDFNVFLKSETGLKEDDNVLVQAALNTISKGFVRVPHRPGTYTFRNTKFRNQFDQFFARGPLRVDQFPYVFPVCSATQEGSGFFHSTFYARNISDHCPASLRVTIDNRAR